MARISSLEDSLVRLVNVLNGQNGQIAVVTEVTQSDPLAGSQTQVVDLSLGQVESDGHGEENAIFQAVLLDDSVRNIVRTCFLLKLIQAES